MITTELLFADFYQCASPYHGYCIERGTGKDAKELKRLNVKAEMVTYTILELMLLILLVKLEFTKYET